MTVVHAITLPFVLSAALWLSLCSSQDDRVAAKVSIVDGAATHDHFIVTFRPSSREARDPTLALQRIEWAVTRATIDLAQPSMPKMAGVKPFYVRQLGAGGELFGMSRSLDAREANALMQTIAQSPLVEYVEPDRTIRRGPSTTLADKLVHVTSTNSDRSGAPWYLSSSAGGIRADHAWETPGADGDGVVVAVLDTGVTRHPDLGTRVEGYTFYVGFNDFEKTAEFSSLGTRRAGSEEMTKAYSVFEASHRFAGGQDTGTWCPDPNSPAEVSKASSSDWHGTAVAGLIAGKTDAAHGISGIAPNATILPVRVIGQCGQTAASAVADAIIWAAGGSVEGVPINVHPANIINLSLTFHRADGAIDMACAPQSAINNAVRWAIQHGSSVVVAAGNDQADPDSPSRNSRDSDFSGPATCPGVISVGATDFQGRRASYSSFAGRITVAAPGGDEGHPIRVLSNNGPVCPSGPSYLDSFGTSLSAPLVSGTIALMISARRNAGLPALSPGQIRTILAQTARPLPKGSVAGISGDPGLLDASAAVSEAATKAAL